MYGGCEIESIYFIFYKSAQLEKVTEKLHFVCDYHLFFTDDTNSSWSGLLTLVHKSSMGSLVSLLWKRWLAEVIPWVADCLSSILSYIRRDEENDRKSRPIIDSISS